MSTESDRDFTIPSMPVPAGTAVSVIIELRLRENSTSSVKGHADAEIRLGPLGSINILGYSIYCVEAKPPVVLPPAQKGERRSFPHVKLTGKLRELVESAILQEYDAAIAEVG
jgi:hypothetical protein